jgi:transposase
MWPGDTADVTTLLPVMARLRKRFSVRACCIVADRGMVSQDNLAKLEEEKIPYILGARMRRTKEVREEVLSRAGRYREVRKEGSPKDPDPLQVKEVFVEDRRYIVCCNPKEARKDALDREAMMESLREKVKSNPGSLVGNTGFRKYLKVNKGLFFIDEDKVKEEARYDGKWVLRTNTDLAPEEVALKYKQLLDVEQVFREMKSVLETRPIFHQTDEAIRDHVFCSFLALLLKKELYRRLEKTGCFFEWHDIKQDLEALQEITIEENGKKLAVRTECAGVCGKIFQAAGVAISPTIKEL